jgi:hypothetical protein
MSNQQLVEQTEPFQTAMQRMLLHPLQDNKLQILLPANHLMQPIQIMVLFPEQALLQARKMHSLARCRPNK